MTGARAIFSINSNGTPTKVAYASGVSWSENISYEPVEVLDLIEVREHVPTGYHCSLNAQIFRRVNNSLKQLSIFPKESNILTSGAMQASVQDRLTMKTLALFRDVKCASQSSDVAARGLVSQGVEFVVISIVDELEA